MCFDEKWFGQLCRMLADQHVERNGERLRSRMSLGDGEIVFEEFLFVNPYDVGHVQAIFGPCQVDGLTPTETGFRVMLKCPVSVSGQWRMEPVKRMSEHMNIYIHGREATQQFRELWDRAFGGVGYTAACPV